MHGWKIVVGVFTLFAICGLTAQIAAHVPHLIAGLIVLSAIGLPAAIRTQRAERRHRA